MAVKINTGDSPNTRQDFFFVDPFEVIVKEELRGRRKPPTEEAIIEMAISLNDHGQQQPVQVRKVELNRILLNLGFTRTAAARLIRTGFKCEDEEGAERTIHDPDFMLKVMVVDANDETAFVANVVENCHRNATTPIDDAFNQQRLRDRHGYTDARIKKLFRYKDENKVARLRRLLNLPTKIQDMVHDYSVTEGRSGMPVNAALELLDMPQDKWEEAIKAATNDSGVVVAARVTTQVREHILNDEERERTGTGPGQRTGSGTGTQGGGQRHKPLSMSEFRKFVQRMIDTTTDDPALLDAVKTLLLFLKGQRNEKKMREVLSGLTKKKQAVA